jgi:hypothetical protein
VHASERTSSPDGHNDELTIFLRRAAADSHASHG